MTMVLPRADVIPGGLMYIGPSLAHSSACIVPVSSGLRSWSEAKCRGERCGEKRLSCSRYVTYMVLKSSGAYEVPDSNGIFIFTEDPDTEQHEDEWFSTKAHPRTFRAAMVMLKPDACTGKAYYIRMPGTLG